jgi:hypothetical protein
MAFKLIEAAQARWRAVNAPHLVALVRAGATFKHGKLVERTGPTGHAERRMVGWVQAALLEGTLELGERCLAKWQCQFSWLDRSWIG